MDEKAKKKIIGLLKSIHALCDGTGRFDAEIAALVSEILKLLK